MSPVTTPIITIAPEKNGTWNCLEVYGNGRITVIQNCAYAFSAHAIAALYADRKKLYFIDPTTRSSFLSITKNGSRFFVIEATPGINVTCRAVAETYSNASQIATRLGNHEKKLFIADFWIEKPKSPFQAILRRAN
ncbi:MAG: hypothetical protein JSS12_07815 [Verrucomicrobia bacterium]|nr:hypothetical protein [Verrucomicrobiota bacterium]